MKVRNISKSTVILGMVVLNGRHIGPVVIAPGEVAEVMSDHLKCFTDDDLKPLSFNIDEPAAKPAAAPAPEKKMSAEELQAAQEDAAMAKLLAEENAPLTPEE